MTLRKFGLVFLLLALASTMLYAQRNRFRGGRFNFSPSFDGNEPPPTEFIFARWHYGAGRYGGGGWAHDYPTAEEHILQIMKEATGINVERISYKIVELGSPEIFKYPFSYVSEPGEMNLTDTEVLNLRQYLNRGGFVMIDDFGGQGNEQREMEQFRSNLLRTFPDRDMFLLDQDHPLLRNFYDIDDLNTVHPMTGVKSIFYGYPDGHGGLSMVICFNNDVGDFWEFIDYPRYPVKPSAEALKLGINFVMYAMTH
jgi:Domain of unknown function (DUF4159)